MQTNRTLNLIRSLVLIIIFVVVGLPLILLAFAQQAITEYIRKNRSDEI